MKDENLVTADLKEIIENLLIILSEKEKNIIRRRYALDRSVHETLAKIGNRYHVTRERVRQIQNSAIKKLQRHVVHTPLRDINGIGKSIIQEHSGLILEETLHEFIEKKLPLKPEAQYITLSLELDNTLVQTGNTTRFRPHFRMANISMSLLVKVSSMVRKELSKKNKVMAENELIKNVVIKTKKEFNLDEIFITSLLRIDKEILFTKKGVGLKNWREINPRTIRDKIFFILREVKKPLHFNEITEKIRARRLDEKPIHIQAVHNELIRNPKCVLIGRGIYALSEWGYTPGTVAEVIENILREASEPMKREKIIEAVQKQRKVKKITILLNLKGKSQFVRVGRDRYGLTNSIEKQ